MARMSIGIAVVLVVVVSVVMGMELSVPEDTAAPAATTPTTTTTTTAPTTTTTTTTTTVLPTTTPWTPPPPPPTTTPIPVAPGDCVINVGTEAEPTMTAASCDTRGQALFRVLTVEPLEGGILPVEPCKGTPRTTHYYHSRQTSSHFPTGVGFLWCLRRIR